MPYDFRSLDVWKEAINFCKEVYNFIKKFPDFEEKNLISQLRRASTSISTNIAEGSGKSMFRDEINFFRIAQGSTKECMSLIFLSGELGYLYEEEVNKLYNQAEYISKMLTLLIRKKKEKYEEFKKHYKT